MKYNCSVQIKGAFLDLSIRFSAMETELNKQQELIDRLHKKAEIKGVPDSFKVSTKGTETFPKLEKTAEYWNKYGEALATNAKIKYQGVSEDSFNKGNYLEAHKF